MPKPNKEPKMSFKDACDIADAMDLPDGAYWAIAHEMAGLEYGDGFDDFLTEEGE